MNPVRKSFQTVGTCSTSVSFSLEDGKLKDVSFESGCPGNLQGIAKLVEGMDVQEVFKRLKGIKCDDKETSCPDQLARALEASGALHDRNP